MDPANVLVNPAQKAVLLHFHFIPMYHYQKQLDVSLTAPATFLASKLSISYCRGPMFQLPSFQAFKRIVDDFHILGPLWQSKWR